MVSDHSFFCQTYKYKSQQGKRTDSTGGKWIQKGCSPMNWFSRWRNCSWLTVYVDHHSPNKHVPKELNHRPVVSITSRCSEIYGSPTVQTVNAWQERMTFESIGPVATGFQQSNSWIKRRTFKPQGTRDTDIRATAVWLQTRIPLGNDLLSRWPQHASSPLGDQHFRFLST